MNTATNYVPAIEEFVSSSPQKQLEWIDQNNDDYEESIPTTSLIESVRSFGYDLNTAVADIVDNSITANATEIKVHLEWNNGEPFVSVTDDGEGMSDAELAHNIVLGSKNPNEERKLSDLGRFGLGMKTASLSMARQLNVFSLKKHGKISFRSWDLDIVEQTGKWLISKKQPRWFHDFPDELKPAESGTLVIWKNCDRILQSAKDLKTLRHKAVELNNHLGVIFSRFLVGRDHISIEVNGNKVEPWSPIPEGARSLSTQHHGHITINPYVLPHKSKFPNDDEFRAAGGVKGWNCQQGFYVFRKNRLIVSGGWLGLKIKKDEHTKLARIIVDIGSELDEEWQINVLKSRASIPAGRVREMLEAIAKATRKEAEEVYRMKGKTVLRSVASRDSFVWQIKKKDNSLKEFRINRAHPSIKDLEECYAGKKSDIERVLVMIERTLPTEAIQVEQTSGQLNVPEIPYEQIKADAELALKRATNIGKPKTMAIKDLLMFEPFSYYKDRLGNELS